MYEMPPNCEWEGCSEERPLYRTPVDVEEGVEYKYFCPVHSTQLQLRHAPDRRLDISEEIVKMFGSIYRIASFDTYIDDPEIFEDINKKLKDRVGGKYYTARHIQQIREVKNKIKSAAERAVETRSGKILVTGPEGNGKTHLAASCARLFMENGLRVVKRSALELTTDIRGTYNRRTHATEQTVKDIITMMLQADAVILDDIDKRCFASDIQGHLFRIVDGLYSNDRIIVMTSNVPILDLRKEDMLGPALIDRFQAPPSVMLELKVPSMRPVNKHLGD